MHLDIQPRHFDLVPGMPQAISVTISNTGSVIGGYAVRVLGADPSWVTIEDDEVSLFPEESRTISVLISVPPGMTAGDRRLSVQVRELTPPEESVVEEVVFTVPEAAAVSLKADPLALTAGRTARLNLLIDNTGNTTLHRRLHGQDPEGQVRFRFDPPVVRLEPGEHALVDLRASASQPLMGNPVIRPMELRLLEPDYVPPEQPEPAPEDEDQQARLAAPKLKRRKKGQGPRIDDEAIPALANATFIQRPRISRGPISLLGLLIAVTVFALVITVALSRIVGQSAADRNLALEIAAAREAGSGVGTAGLTGRVTELTSAQGAPGVAVSVFAADDSENALVTTATARDGGWKIDKLPAGDYLITFQGAGFQQLWYPQALAAEDAEPVTLEPGKQQPGLDVALGGIPASISGEVDGPDVSAATLTLKRPLTGMTAPTVATPGGSVVDAEQGATVMSVPIGDDGAFVLENVPSPSTYDLVVEKPGFATSTQRVDVSAGEKRTGVEITLRQGDGVISGQVRSAAGPLGEATVTATSGQLSVSTMSVNEGSTASFALRGLPTPATFTVVVSKEGYATQTITISLGEGQRLAGVDAALDSSSGRLDGQVLTYPDDDPAAGVLVSVTDGVQTVQTASTSPGEDQEGGLWSVSGLALPGEYTVTFSRPDLESQTIGVSLDAQGAVTAVGDGDGDGLGDQTEPGGAGMITASLRSATAEVDALVLQRTARGASSFRPLGEATVTLTSSGSSYSVTSASLPARDLGRYRIVGVPPGSYTLSVGRAGVAPVSRVVELTAGEVWAEDTRLEPPAMLSGTIKAVGSDEGVGQGWIVDLYRYDSYPGTVYRSVRSTAGGRFVFSDIDAPQAYVVQVRRTSSAEPSGSAAVSMLASDEKDITVRVRSDG